MNERRLFADGKFYTPDGRTRLLFEAPTPPPEKLDRSFPLWLNTGRGSSVQWHTGSRTNKSAVLRKLAPTRLYVEYQFNRCRGVVRKRRNDRAGHVSQRQSRCCRRCDIDRAARTSIYAHAFPGR